MHGQILEVNQETVGSLRILINIGQNAQIYFFPQKWNKISVNVRNCIQQCLRANPEKHFFTGEVLSVK
ncbi:hypothetical protein ACH3XW_17345 [Acanthocheilonema viteae]